MRGSNSGEFVRQLCESAGVSRSGYYHYLNAEDVRLRREAQDRADFDIILDTYNYRGYGEGISGIYISNRFAK